MGFEQRIWKELASKPVPGNAPAGQPARYDPSYELIQTEIQKLDGLSNQPPNWKEVVNLGKDILQNKSKDMLVACYLAFGLFRQEKYEGLLNGLICLETLVQEYWETLFPDAKRMRARINAISWFSQNLGSAVAKLAPEGEERRFLNPILTKIEMLEKFLREKLGNDSPGLGDLRRALSELRQSPGEPDSTVGEGQKEEEAKSIPAPPSPGIVPGEIKSLDDIKPVLRDAKNLIYRAGAFLQEKDPVQGWPYRSVRFLTWLEMENLPAQEEGMTRIPPPPNHLFRLFENLIEKQSWSELLNQAESRMSEFPFWLDLYRFSDLAMVRLGKPYEKLREETRFAFSGFLNRLSGIQDLQFAGHVPFADDKTKQWIESEVVSFPENLGGKSTQNLFQTEDRFEADLNALRKQADQLRDEGSFKDGLALLIKECSRAERMRERFLFRMEMVRYCLESEQLKMALSQLEGLEKQIEQHCLEEWDPELSFELYRIYLHTLNKRIQEVKQVSPDLLTKVELVHRRLCRLDPVSAMELDDKTRPGWFGR